MAIPRLPTIVLAILIIAVSAGLTIYWFRRPVPSDRRQVMDVLLHMQQLGDKAEIHAPSPKLWRVGDCRRQFAQQMIRGD